MCPILQAKKWASPLVHKCQHHIVVVTLLVTVIICTWQKQLKGRRICVFLIHYQKLYSPLWWGSHAQYLEAPYILTNQETEMGPESGFGLYLSRPK